jgi:Ca2+/Na+ antiporter
MKDNAATISVLIVGYVMIVFVAVKSSLDVTVIPVYSLILTALLVVVTAVYVLLTWRVVQASNRQAEIMLESEYDRSAPVIKLDANGTTDISISWENVGNGPALNFKCWIEDSEHLELHAGNKDIYHVTIAEKEKGVDTIQTGITGYTLKTGNIHASYQSIHGKTYESCLFFSTNSSPELKYGESKMAIQLSQIANANNVAQPDRIEQRFVKQKAMPVSILIGFALGAIVFCISILTKDTKYSLDYFNAIGILTIILFILYLLYSIISQFVSLICKKYLFTKEIGIASLIYIGIYAFTLSYYPDFINKMLEKWDFRFAAFGLSLISLALAMLPRDKTNDRPS